MSDQQIACSECGDTFVFTEAEQAFYREKGLAAPPKRCKACRQARKAASGRGGAPPRSGGRPGGPPRHVSNDARSGGSWGAPPGGDRGRANGPRPNDRGPRANGPRPNDRPPHDRAPRAHGGNSRGFAPRAESRGPSEYRSPAFPEQRWEPRGDDARPARAANERPREAAPRPERPKFDITCAECGVAAQVPFKPIEGRQVFCQECYRARRGVARPGETHDVAPDVDGGIVE